MKTYESNHLVKGEDLNHHGTLFAAKAASWFVEAAFVAAACEHGNTSEIVCRNLQEMSFTTPLEKGAVVQITSKIVEAGRTSLKVYVEMKDSISQAVAVTGYVIFVTVDADTRTKIPHGIIVSHF